MRLIFLIILNLVLLYKIQFWQYAVGSVQLWDFDTYYRTVGDVLAGQNPYQLPYMQISGPPLLLVPFVPFQWVPLTMGRSIINCLSLVAGLGACWLVVSKVWSTHGRLNKLRLALLLNALLLMTFPARFNFITGQPNLILMWLVSLILVTTDQRKQGIAAGLLAMVKTNYLLVLVIFLKKLRGSFAVSLTMLMVGLVISLSLFSPEGTIDFLSKRGPSFALTAAPTGDVDYYNQSLRATMGRFQIGQWYPLAFALLVVIGLIYLFKTGDVIGGVITSLVLSPIVWQHYIVVVYPILILIAYQLWQERRLDRWFLLASFLLLLHFPRLHGHPAMFPYNVLASHYFFGLGILWAYLIGRGRIVA